MSTMYCQGVGADPFHALAALTRSGPGVPATEQFTGCVSIPTHQARTAISLILRHWRIGPGDTVLVPSYNCGTEIDPIIKAGATVKAYRVDDDLRPDLDDIRRRLTAGTRVIYVTHYFGFPQELKELRKLCDERGAFLLEDCALALFSRGPDGYVGRIGDAGVFSLPKTLPVPDGGILVMPRGELIAPSVTPRLSRTCRKLLPLFKRAFLRRTELLGLYRLLDQPRLEDPDESATPLARPDIPNGYYFDPATADWGMSRMTRSLLCGVDGEIIVERRRKNYSKLYSEISNLRGISQLLGDLPAGVCLLGLPIRVRDRSQWISRLRASHIDAYPWWSGYHRGIDWNEFPEACRLKDEVVLLPVHQQLSTAHMDHIAKCVGAIAGDCSR
jgi:dTDP-4-amino-4,6-dideoxygalactose transaminase